MVETRRGTRPGGPWADVLFHLAFTRIAAREDIPPPGGVVPVMEWDGRRTPTTAPSEAQATARLRVRDITFADDLAVCSVSTAAVHLSAATTHAAGTVLSSFGEHGLVANYGPAKTAVLLAPVGHGSKAVRHRIFNLQKGQLPTLLEHGGGVCLQAVHKYKHLGCMVTHTGHLLTEIRRRVHCAGSSFQEGRRLVFCCPRVELLRRVRLFQSRILSILFHGAGTWHTLAVGEFQEISSAYLAFCRKLLRIPKTADQHWTSAQIFVGVGLSDTLTCLRIERLRFLAQLSVHAADNVWAVARADPGFVTAQQDALTWLYGLLHPTVKMPSPLDDWGAWAALITERSRKWKGWLERAAELQLRRLQLRSCLERMQRTVWESDGDTPLESLAELAHCCLSCKKAFATKQAWAAHAAKAHGYRALHTRLAVGTQCQACGRKFATHPKFVKHLQALPKCMAVIVRLEQEGRLVPHAEDEGHVQAPPVPGHLRPTIAEELGQESVELIRDIREQSPRSCEDLVAVVCRVTAPFSVLRLT